MSLQNHILEASKKKIKKINICQTSNECHRIFHKHCRFLVALQLDIHLLDTLGQKRKTNSMWWSDQKNRFQPTPSTLLHWSAHRNTFQHQRLVLASSQMYLEGIIFTSSVRYAACARYKSKCKTTHQLATSYKNRMQSTCNLSCPFHQWLFIYVQM